MFGAEHAAPRLSEQVVATGDAETLEEILEFVEKEIDGPEVRAFVAQVRGLAVAELVVVNDRASGVRDVGDGEQVVVRAAGPAVHRDEWCERRGEVAGDAVPGVPRAEGDGGGGGGGYEGGVHGAKVQPGAG